MPPKNHLQLIRLASQFADFSINLIIITQKNHSVMARGKAGKIIQLQNFIGNISVASSDYGSSSNKHAKKLLQLFFWGARVEESKEEYMCQSGNG